MRPQLLVDSPCSPVRTDRRQRTSSAPDLRLRLEIETIAKGGEGVGHAQVFGRRCAVLVARTAPGDIVDVEVGRAAGALRGRLLAVVQASPVRVHPVCPHADACGGCDLMHVDPAVQHDARVRIVRHALGTMLGGVEPRAHRAPVAEGYRTRIRLAVDATKGRSLVGFRRARSHRIVEVDRCLVASPVLDGARAEVSAWLGSSRGKGELTLATGMGGRPAIYLEWEGELGSTVFREAEERVLSGRWAGVRFALSGANRPTDIGDPRTVTTGVDGMALVAPPGGFSQAFDAMNKELAGAVVGAAGRAGRKTWELFAGSGNFTVGLAREAETLESVESDAAAVEAARTNLQARGLRAKLRCADADAVDVGDDVRVVVMDPPRTGAPGASLRTARSRARRVVMVSCDPATLARDVRMLTNARFVVKSVDVFEMFPHTSHVESMVVLEREPGARSG